MAKKVAAKGTGKKAAQAASEVLKGKGTKKGAKSAAGSALSQKKKGKK